LSFSTICKAVKLFRYYVFVCILPEKAVPEMTYTLSGGMINPTHSFLIRSRDCYCISA